MTYNIGCVGHIDLIVGMPCKGHLKTHHARVQLLVSSSYSLCLVYRRMDVQTYRRTDVLTDGCRTKPDNISTAELKALSCAKKLLILDDLTKLQLVENLSS